MPPSQADDKRQAAREVIDILHEISTLLNTHLDRTELSLCVSLIENGVNPEALAVGFVSSSLFCRFWPGGSGAERSGRLGGTVLFCSVQSVEVVAWGSGSWGLTGWS
ncbi:hypothetical protein BO99DRAFT_403264 [Aspergillus violaceofuscus CBS 115571]|uniref:Mitotic-spindle organizing protein 1 n=1 Tax=Aspergillus violaceofuscus (strain CBS 115571) TaxID=1450538 RepID=A0A2V5HAF3_ASPV1|nr:hypothetical protein BO99DRAFT_403264 [Aspergillus violaceofuscus CBS 115571]